MTVINSAGMSPSMRSPGLSSSSSTLDLLIDSRANASEWYDSPVRSICAIYVGGHR